MISLSGLKLVMTQATLASTWQAVRRASSKGRFQNCAQSSRSARLLIAAFLRIDYQMKNQHQKAVLASRSG
jgi:hypothetical protein